MPAPFAACPWAVTGSVAVQQSLLRENHASGFVFLPKPALAGSAALTGLRFCFSFQCLVRKSLLFPPQSSISAPGNAFCAQQLLQSVGSLAALSTFNHCAGSRRAAHPCVGVGGCCLLGSDLLPGLSVSLCWAAQPGLLGKAAGACKCFTKCHCTESKCCATGGVTRRLLGGCGDWDWWHTA